MHFYCVKCKHGFESNPEENKTMKNGRHAVVGTCPSCKTRSFKIVSGKK